MMPNIIQRNRPRSEPVLTLLSVPSPKPQLEMLVLPVFRVKYKTLEGYIKSVYRFEFDFLLATGQLAGTCPQYRVTAVPDSLAWKARAHELRCGRRTRDVSLILNVLATDGFIPKGLYTIDTHEVVTKPAAEQEKT